MKYILLCAFLVGCSNDQETFSVLNKTIKEKEEKIEQLNNKVYSVKDEIRSLNEEYNKLPQVQMNQLKEKSTQLQVELEDKQNKINALTDLLIKHNGQIKDDQRYVVKFELKQSRFSLDIGEHLKDSMNSTEFELPVNKEFYDSVHVGQELVDKFRTGSLLISGSFSKWKVTILEKKAIKP